MKEAGDSVFDLLESLECAWFGPSPGTSCKTHDSAHSLAGARVSRSKAARQALERESAQQKPLRPPGPHRGSNDSLASTAHSVGSAESLPERSTSLEAVEDASGEAATPRGIAMSSSAMSPRPQPGRQPDAFDPCSLPGLGTWAQRQFRFQPSSSGDSPQQPQEQSGTPTMPIAGRGVRSSSTPKRGASEDEDDVAAQAAWRWRFNRRWALEQAKQWDPESARRSLDGDAWDDALEVLGACGPAGRSGMAHTVSTEHELLTPRTPRPLSPRGSNLSTCMLGESRPEPAPVPDPDNDSTQKAAALARKAHSLWRQQLQIERQVDERWNNAAAQGAEWVGRQLSTVCVDTYGRFDFVLVRVSERRGPAKLVVRGSHASAPTALQQALHQQAESIRRAESMPPVSLTLLGVGSMEWLGEREDTVHLRCSEAVQGVEGALASGQDVARVTGSLMRSALPLHQRLHVHIL